jgi:hypothetical protein
VLHVPAEPFAAFRRRAGDAPFDQHDAEAFLEELTRWETAEGVTFSALAALSKLPVCTTVATARRAG